MPGRGRLGMKRLTVNPRLTGTCNSVDQTRLRVAMATLSPRDFLGQISPQKLSYACKKRLDGLDGHC